MLSILNFLVLATIEPLDESVCLGQRAQWTCTANGSLGWRLERVGQPSSVVNHFYFNPDTDEDTLELPLGSGIQTIVLFIRGTVYNSKATAANVTTSLNGTRLSCTVLGGVFGDPRVDITIKGTSIDTVHRIGLETTLSALIC